MFKHTHATVPVTVSIGRRVLGGGRHGITVLGQTFGRVLPADKIRFQFHARLTREAARWLRRTMQSPQDPAAEALQVLLAKTISVLMNHIERTDAEVDALLKRNPNLFLPLEYVGLHVQTLPALTKAFQCEIVWQLVEKTPAEVMAAAGIGERRLQEIQTILADLGLRLGMRFTAEERQRFERFTTTPWVVGPLYGYACEIQRTRSAGEE